MIENGVQISVDLISLRSGDPQEAVGCACGLVLSKETLTGLSWSPLGIRISLVSLGNGYKLPSLCICMSPGSSELVRRKPSVL